ncbi:glycoside hydrolase family 10 protein [Actinacidiphila sp. bgisy167]|uniref:glycoside hydrolase family 10 protein n=1 Tax=Actinacidiphila sp. bgisy167 TaxID=3413797 RepID=UPI003D719E59
MRPLSRRTFAAGAAGAVGAVLAAGPAAGARGTDGTVVAGGPSGAREPSGTAGAVGAAAGQFRGMWLATVANRDWPSARGLPASRQRDELLRYLDLAVERRLNAVVMQVRPTADALWPSPYEPWSQYLTGVQGRDPGWDPLGTAVAEAHARGLELHAWFNPFRVATHTDPRRLAPDHPARVHPDWIVTYGGKLYYNPGIPRVRRFVQEAMLDAVRRYPVDGVHWDDYFYPYPVAGRSFADEDAFARYGAGFDDRASWRRGNIDLLVSETAARVKALRPTTRFGVSPFAVWRNQRTDPRGSATRGGVQTYDDLYADTRGWVREGWIDYIVPQVYWNIGFDVADYATLVAWWADVVDGTGVHLYIGEALYRAGSAGEAAAWQDPAELSRHLELARRHPQVRGHVFFSAKEVAADPIGAMSRVVADHYPTRVRTPARGSSA